MMFIRIIKYFILVNILIILFPNYLLSQNFERGTYYFPHEKDLYEYSHSLNLSLSQLPEDMIEEANSLIYFPMIIYDASFQLPKNLNLHMAFTTNIVSNHFAFGASWKHKKNNFSISTGYDIAFWFGILDEFDFESRNVGWLHYPNLTIGFLFNKYTISLRSEVVLNTSLTQFVDDIEIISDKNTFSGYGFELLLEQPLWKNNFMIIGFKLNITRFYYSAWLVYTDNVKYRYIPEVKIGFVL